MEQNTKEFQGLREFISEEEMKKNKYWGLHASIDLYDCDPMLIKSFPDIKRYVKELCLEIDMERHGETLVERFAEGYYEGVSMMQFIETSSVTAHFDENENRAFLDIFSCKFFDGKKALEFSKKFFKASRHKIRMMYRD